MLQMTVTFRTSLTTACNREVTSTCNLKKFADYLVDKASVIRDTMLRPIRVECGLGCPPGIFTTKV